jgi:hypothetical protein
MISTFARLSAALGAAALAAGCATGEQALKDKGVRSLDRNALQQTFATRPSDFTWSNDRGLRGTLSYRPDGTLSVNWGQGADTGTYRITPEGEICSRWKTLRAGAEECSRVYSPAADLYVSFPPGSGVATELRPVR